MLGYKCLELPDANETVRLIEELAGRKVELIGNNDPNNGTELSNVLLDKKNERMGVNFIGTDHKAVSGKKLAKSALSTANYHFSHNNKLFTNVSTILEFEQQQLLIEQKKTRPTDRIDFTLRSSVIDFKEKKIDTVSLGDMICLVVDKDGKVKTMAKRQVSAMKTNKTFENDPDVVVPGHFPRNLKLAEMNYKKVQTGNVSGEVVVPEKNTIRFEDSDTLVFASPELFFGLVSADELGEKSNLSEVRLYEKLNLLMAETAVGKEEEHVGSDIGSKLQRAIQKNLGRGRKPYNIVVVSAKTLG